MPAQLLSQLRAKQYFLYVVKNVYPGIIGGTHFYCCFSVARYFITKVAIRTRNDVTIRIEKTGLKDARQCTDPYITVRVKDLNGIDLTPVASRKDDTYAYFNVDIELQKHVEKLTKGAAISFNSNTTSLKKGFPAPSVVLSWRWTKLSLGQL